MADNNLNANELEALMISELPTQATANETDLFEVAIVDTNSASGYASKKESAAAIADAIVGEYQYPLRLTETTSKKISGAINEIAGKVADLQNIEGSASGDIATFGDGSDNPLKELKISIVATQSGTGDPSPDNVRPISGFNSVDVGDISDTEKVQYFKGLLEGTYGFVDMGDLIWAKYPTGDYPYFYTNLDNLDYTQTEVILQCSTYKAIAGMTSASFRGSDYNLQICNITNQSATHNVGVQDSNYADADAFKTAVSGVYLIYKLATPTTPTITPTIFNTLVSAFGLQGWLVQIAMPTEAGTVYGGTLDVKTGVLTVTHSIVDLGDLSWTYYSVQNVFAVNFAGAKPSGGSFGLDALCSCYAVKTDARYQNLPDKSIMVGSNFYSYETAAVIVKDTDYTDATAFKTAVTGQKLVYPLATPIEYDLTPQQINSLLGTNNIFANCGAITELKYTRDLNLCINDIIARIEALEGGSSNRSLSVSPTFTKSLTSELDTAEGILEETEEETKEEAQNER